MDISRERMEFLLINTRNFWQHKVEFARYAALSVLGNGKMGERNESR